MTYSIASLEVHTDQAHPLMHRLVRDFGATWVDETTVKAWTTQSGHRVVLLAGDPVRYPEGVDVAAVLPELCKACGQTLQIAIAARKKEDAIAALYGSNHWPTLLFFRDGQYTTSLPNMHDWDVFVQKVQQALEHPPTRIPSIGIAVVSDGGGGGGSGCH